MTTICHAQAVALDKHFLRKNKKNITRPSTPPGHRHFRHRRRTTTTTPPHTTTTTPSPTHARDQDIEALPKLDVAGERWWGAP
jgi:hypothetical protein